MASIRREFTIERSVDDVWNAVRDVGALHTRLVPGFVTDCRLEEGARIVTFGNGMVVEERIVDLDETARRLAWSATGGRLTHHNASMQLFSVGKNRTHAVWIADLLPDEMAKPVAAMIDQGCAAMKKALDRVG